MWNLQRIPSRVSLSVILIKNHKVKQHIKKNTHEHIVFKVFGLNVVSIS